MGQEPGPGGVGVKAGLRGWESRSRLSPDDRLLLLCSRIDLPPGQREALRRIASGQIDWDLLLRRAGRHGVLPLVYRHLQGLRAEISLPVSAWNGLEAAFHSARLMSLRQTFECGRLLAAFRPLGIEAIVLKGLALRETVYPDPALRPSGDIDLLVERAALDRAEQALLATGYAADESKHTRGWFRANRHHLAPYCRPGGDVQVEIHWDLVLPGGAARPDVDGLWRRATPCNLAGQPALLLSPEDQVLHLALHAAQANALQIGLRHLADMAETLRRYREQINFEYLLALACGWGAQRHLYLTLRVADELLGPSVPSSLLDVLRPQGFDEALTAAACERILSLAPPTAEGQLVQSAAHFLRASSVRERFGWLWQNLCLPREQMARLYRLPAESKWVWGCYGLRPLHLAGSYAGLLLRLALRRKEASAAADALRRQQDLDRWLAPVRGSRE